MIIAACARLLSYCTLYHWSHFFETPNGYVCVMSVIEIEENDHYENWIDNNGATDDDMNILPFTSFSRFPSSSWLAVSVEASVHYNGAAAAISHLATIPLFILCAHGVPFNLILYTINVLWSQTIRLEWACACAQFQCSLNFSSDRTAPIQRRLNGKKIKNACSIS